MPTLFNCDNSESDEDLKINTDYAKNYNNWRQKEELNKLKTKYGNISESGASDEDSDTESSSEEEEEEENELTQQFDKDFYKTLALLKNKDPKIYNQDVTFFDDTNKAQEIYTEQKKHKTKKEKAVFLRDYERNIIVERDGKFSDSEDESTLKKKEEDSSKITYVQEQRQLKESFKDALHDEEDDADLLKPKSKSESEKQKEEADYKEWLKGQEVVINETEQEVLKPLRDFWSNPNLDTNEKFLRDYILNNKYLDNDYAGPDADDIHVHDSDENLSEDEKNITKQEEFEHKYNFRFEEPDQEFIKRYPRTMENSLRRKDTRRAQKRAEVKQRKEEEKLKKKEELKQLKALKRKEIEEKIEKLKEITGNDDIQFNDIDLDGDFDPTEHDRKMTQIFNDDYYAVPEDDVKPEFPEVDEELEIEDTWDNYDPTTDYYNEEEYEGPHCEDQDFNMDADYDPTKSIKEEVEGTKKRKRRRKSKFAELISKEKPKFDPEVHRSYEEYFDKYYSLDYEDMIGDIPCRFKYRKVVPNDYGLSIEEILAADDKELNKWCSLKKALQYKPEHAELNDVQMYKQKAKNESLKKKILRSLYTNPEDEEEADKKEIVNNLNTVQSTEAKKRRRKKKKPEVQNNSTTETVSVTNKELEKREKNANVTQKKAKESSKAEKRKTPEEESQQPPEKKRNLNNSHEEQGKNLNNEEPDKSNVKHSKKQKMKEETIKKKKKKMLDKIKKKGTKNNNMNGDVASLNPERLKMYGLNPKKLKNKLKYKK